MESSLYTDWQQTLSYWLLHATLYMLPSLAESALTRQAAALRVRKKKKSPANLHHFMSLCCFNHLLKVEKLKLLCLGDKWRKDITTDDIREAGLINTIKSNNKSSYIMTENISVTSFSSCHLCNLSASHRHLK